MNMNMAKSIEAMTRRELNELLVKVTKKLDSVSIIRNTSTPVNEWLETNKKEMNVRLYNCLREAWEDDTDFIELIDARDLLRYRNLGKKSYFEFIELRGY